MLYNVIVKDEACYFDIDANSPEEAEQVALEWFDERYHATIVEESDTFSNAMYDIVVTDEIYKVITKCPHLELDDCQECVKHCPLAKVCYSYWTGED